MTCCYSDLCDERVRLAYDVFPIALYDFRRDEIMGFFTISATFENASGGPSGHVLWKGNFRFEASHRVGSQHLKHRFGCVWIPFPNILRCRPLLIIEIKSEEQKRFVAYVLNVLSEDALAAQLDCEIRSLVLFGVFHLSGKIENCRDSGHDCCPSTKRRNPLAKTVCFIAAAGELANCESAKKQENQQHRRHPERNVPPQPIALIVSLFVHLASLLIVASRIGERSTYLQWGRAA